MAVEQKRITLEEFLDRPEEKPALEYVDGEVVQKVPPSTPHSALQYFFCAHVNSFAHPRRLAWAFPEHRTTYAGRSTVPDVTVYTWDRVPRDASRRLATRNLTPPDIAVEIRSPDQSFQDSLIRCLWYIANGARPHGSLGAGVAPCACGWMNRPVRTRMPGGVGGGAGNGSAYPIVEVRSLTLAVRISRPESATLAVGTNRSR